MMITLVGTGHIFRIAEPVSFIVKNIWPDAVLVELDQKRFDVISSPRSEGGDPGGSADAGTGAGGGTGTGRGTGAATGGDAASKQYRKMAEYQRDMAESYDSKVGAEFIAAVGAGKMIGAAIEFVDKDAQETMREMWDEMSFTERTRFRLSRFGDMFRKKKRAETVVTEFADDEESYINDMRRKYPTLVRKLIDERNEHMASKISEAATRYENIVVVVGDAHVEGIARLITARTGPAAEGTSSKDMSAVYAASDATNIRKIRLKTLMSTELMNQLRSELWSGRPEDAGTSTETGVSGTVSDASGTADACGTGTDVSGTEPEHSFETEEMK
ncbi:MAG: TraB domain-containing protein [Methanomassiliicoccaceae archaeon]|nr:TraB domain-containing protein [Methanomassiliicoccaceae archaeon]